MTTNDLRFHWPVYSGPNTDVPCRVGVSVVSVSTLNAPKDCLTRSVALVNAAAGRAGLRCIPRIHEDHRHTGKCSLVDDLRFQVGKRPAMQLRALTAASLYPIANAREFFKGNGATGAMRLLHDLLADDVVSVFRKSRLASTNLTQFALGVLCPLLLQPLSFVAILAAKIVDLVATEPFPIRIGSNRGDAQIYTDHITHIGRRRLLDFTSHEQIHPAVYLTQIRLTAFALQQFALSLTAHKLDCLSAVYRPDGDGGLVGLERQDAGIVSDCAQWLKRMFLIAIDGVAGGDFRHAADDNLRGQHRELRAAVLVGCLLQPKLVEHAPIKRNVRQPVTRRIGDVHSANECIRLFWRGLECNLSNKFHGSDCSANVLLSNAIGGIEIPIRLTPPRRGVQGGGFNLYRMDVKCALVWVRVVRT